VRVSEFCGPGSKIEIEFLSLSHSFSEINTLVLRECLSSPLLSSAAVLKVFGVFCGAKIPIEKAHLLIASEACGRSEGGER
jgi:hypothetical protein